jgi:hypothetical protein
MHTISLKEMKGWITLGVVGASLWACNYEAPARWKGLPAGKAPIQTSQALPPVFTHQEYSIQPLAGYSVTAVVLSRDRYRFDAAAKLCPMDLALGWGPMSAASVINQLKISQGGRFYEYSWKDEPPLDPALIVSNSANTHCIPADDAVRSKLLAVKRHDIVTLRGYLVEVRGANGFHWRSSLTRDDSRGGACELLWVTEVERKRPPSSSI